MLALRRRGCNTQRYRHTSAVVFGFALQLKSVNSDV